jgi:hypothetical protein
MCMIEEMRARAKAGARVAVDRGAMHAPQKMSLMWLDESMMNLHSARLACNRCQGWRTARWKHSWARRVAVTCMHPHSALRHHLGVSGQESDVRQRTRCVAVAGAGNRRRRGRDVLWSRRWPACDLVTAGRTLGLLGSAPSLHVDCAPPAFD